MRRGRRHQQSIADLEEVNAFRRAMGKPPLSPPNQDLVWREQQDKYFPPDLPAKTATKRAWVAWIYASRTERRDEYWASLTYVHKIPGRSEYRTQTYVLKARAREGQYAGLRERARCELLWRKATEPSTLDRLAEILDPITGWQSFRPLNDAQVAAELMAFPTLAEFGVEVVRSRGLLAHRSTRLFDDHHSPWLPESDRDQACLAAWLVRHAARTDLKSAIALRDVFAKVVLYAPYSLEDVGLGPETLKSKVYSKSRKKFFVDLARTRSEMRRRQGDRIGVSDWGSKADPERRSKGEGDELLLDLG